MGREGRKASLFRRAPQREHREECSCKVVSWLRSLDLDIRYLLRGTGLGDGQADTQDGIGTQLGLVRSTIELVQELVDLLLLGNIDVLLDESRTDDLVDIGNSLQDTFPSPVGLVAVSELASFVLACISAIDQSKSIE